MRIDDENKVGIYNDLLKDDFDKFEKVEYEYSKLEFIRTGKGISRKSLSEMCANKDFDANHMLLSIIRIETGKIVCPRPRKTYEYKRLAKVLKCNVDDIYGLKERSNEL